ncbi:MAG: amino acid adenylation domain-containing protein [Spirochaetales bacterium]|nr:amino acid adenylation domain-containing protein [Spirochaetales bacterium]
MNRLLHHLFEKSARRYPGAVAVGAGDIEITYRVLREKSNALARRLIALGFGPRSTAGVYIDKSIEAIVTMIAVLKTGGIYIPLDAFYSPPARIKNIIASSGTRYIVTTSGLWGGFVSKISGVESGLISGMHVILVDNLLEKDAGAGGGTPRAVSKNDGLVCFHHCDGSDADAIDIDPAVTDGDPAYILYTSGSTGDPKGVVISHRNARAFVDWALSTFRPGNRDVFSNVAPLHFDLSVFDIYVPLACGASVRILPQTASGNPRALVDWIEENRITYFYSVPSVWISILHYANIHRDSMQSLTHILFAGEVFPPRHLRRLMGLIPRAEYYNLYGPTETNVCTFYHVRDRDSVTDIPVPIGSACRGTETIVVKVDDTEALPGEEGELLVRGPLVCSGYYGDPVRTEACFRESPLPRHNRALFYRTGDIVRVVGEGEYRYVGRKDLMVKCSGFRVELQEVETAFLKHARVGEAVVVPVYDSDRINAGYLAAFVTVTGTAEIRAIELKSFLAGVIPRYMIPEEIIVLGSMPKNTNGKTDRLKLQERANNRQTAEEYAAGAAR